MCVSTLICESSYACQYIEIRRLKATESGYWLLIQGALAAIRIVIWVLDPAWDDIQVVQEDPERRSGNFLWNYDLTETRLAVLCASLQSEIPEWLRNVPLFTEIPFFYDISDLCIPKWVLPALQPRNQNPEKMFELARKLQCDNSEWDESLQVLQNAEDSWNIPREIFMAWVFAWPESDSSWVDGFWKNFSCTVIKDKQYENGEQRLHFLPCWCNTVILKNNGLKVCAPRIFGVPHNRNRWVFAMDHKLVLGWDTSLSLDSIDNEWHIETIPQTMKMMWRTLDPIIEAHPDRPSYSLRHAAPFELYAPTDRVRTSQQESPTRSVASAPLPGANDATQLDADIIRPQPRRRSY